MPAPKVPIKTAVTALLESLRGVKAKPISLGDLPSDAVADVLRQIREQPAAPEWQVAADMMMEQGAELGVVPHGQPNPWQAAEAVDAYKSGKLSDVNPPEEFPISWDVEQVSRNLDEDVTSPVQAPSPNVGPLSFGIPVVWDPQVHGQGTLHTGRERFNRRIPENAEVWRRVDATAEAAERNRANRPLAFGSEFDWYGKENIPGAVAVAGTGLATVAALAPGSAQAAPDAFSYEDAKSGSDTFSYEAATFSYEDAAGTPPTPEPIGSPALSPSVLPSPEGLGVGNVPKLPTVGELAGDLASSFGASTTNVETPDLGRVAGVKVKTPVGGATFMRMGGKAGQPPQTTFKVGTHDLTIQDPALWKQAAVLPGVLDVVDQVVEQVAPTVHKYGRKGFYKAAEVETAAMKAAGVEKRPSKALELLLRLGSQMVAGGGIVDEMSDKDVAQASQEMEDFYAHPLMRGAMAVGTLGNPVAGAAQLATPGGLNNPEAAAAMTMGLSEQLPKLPLYLISGSRLVALSTLDKVGKAAGAVGTGLAAGMANVAATLPEVGDFAFGKEGERGEKPSSAEAFGMGFALPVGSKTATTAAPVVIGIGKKALEPLLDGIFNVGQSVREPAIEMAKGFGKALQKAEVEGQKQALIPFQAHAALDDVSALEKVDLTKTPKWKASAAQLVEVDGKVVLRAAYVNLKQKRQVAELVIESAADIDKARKLLKRSGVSALSTQKVVENHRPILQAIEGTMPENRPLRAIDFPTGKGTNPGRRRPIPEGGLKSADDLIAMEVQHNGTVTIDRITNPGLRERALRARGGGVVEITLPNGEKRYAIDGGIGADVPEVLKGKPVEGARTYRTLLPFDDAEGITGSIQHPMELPPGAKVQKLTPEQYKELAAKQPARVEAYRKQAQSKSRPVVRKVLETRPVTSYDELLEKFMQHLEKKLDDPKEAKALQEFYGWKKIKWFRPFGREKRKIIGTARGADATSMMALKRAEDEAKGLKVDQDVIVRKMDEETRQFYKNTLATEFGLDDRELIGAMLNDIYRKVSGAEKRMAAAPATLTDIRTAQVGAPGSGVFKPPEVVTKTSADFNKEYADRLFENFKKRIENAKSQNAAQKAAEAELIAKKAKGTPVESGRIVNVPEMPTNQTMVDVREPPAPVKLPEILPHEPGPQSVMPPEGPIEEWQRMIGQRGAPTLEEGESLVQHVDGTTVRVKQWDEDTGAVVFEYPDGSYVAGHARDIVGEAARAPSLADAHLPNGEAVEHAFADAFVQHGTDAASLNEVQAGIIAAARKSGVPDEAIAKAFDKVESGDVSSVLQKGPTGIVPPPPPRPPAIDGLPPTGGGPPPPPHAFSPSYANELDVLAKTPALWKLRHAVWGVTSTGARDLAQMAAMAASRKNLEAGYRMDIFRRMNKVFGPDNVAGNKALDDWFRGRKSMEQLSNDFPQLKVETQRVLEDYRVQRDANEAELMKYGVLPPKDLDIPVDELEAWAPITYMRYLLKPGEWVNVLKHDKVKWARLKSAVMDPKNKLIPEGIHGQPDVSNWADNFIAELAGSGDAAEFKAAGNLNVQISAAAQSLKARQDLSPLLKEILGETVDGRVSVPMALARQKALVHNMRMWEEVRARPDWFRPADSPPPLEAGWRKLEGGPRQYGRAAGGYLRPDVFDALVAAPNTIHTINPIVAEMASWMKGNQVVLGGPSSWVNNIMGNLLNSHLAGGIDLFTLDAAGGKGMVSAFLDMYGHRKNPGTTAAVSEGAALVERARQLGVDAPGWATTEVATLQEALHSALIKELKLAGAEGIGGLRTLRVLRKVAAQLKFPVTKLAPAYDFIDRWFKYANWKTLRERGMNNPEWFLGEQFRKGMSQTQMVDLVEREASRRIHESFPMPDRVQPWLRKLRHATPILGNNYLTYRIEQARVYSRIPVRALTENGFGPRMLLAGLIAEGLKETLDVYRRENGISDETVQAAFANMPAGTQANRPAMLAMWYRDENGKPVFHDFSAWLEFTTYMRGNPEADAVSKMAYNVLNTPFEGGLIDEAGGVDRAARLIPGVQSAVPETFHPPDRPWQQTAAAAMDSAMRTGALPAFPERMMRQAAGSLIGQKPLLAPVLDKPHAAANLAGARFVPAGDPGHAARMQAGKLMGAQSDLKAAPKLQEQQVLGAVQYFMSKGHTRDEAIRLAIEALKKTAAGAQNWQSQQEKPQ